MAEPVPATDDRHPAAVVTSMIAMSFSDGRLAEADLAPFAGSLPRRVGWRIPRGSGPDRLTRPG